VCTSRPPLDPDGIQERFSFFLPVVIRVGRRRLIKGVEDRHVRLLDDGELVAAMAEGRTDALEEAYRRHSAAVFGLARRVLNEVAAAEEVVQDVIVRLWRRPERFDPQRGTLRSYLLIDTKARAIEIVRRASARRSREERHVRLDVPPVPDVECEATEQLIAGHLQDALSCLTHGEREVIELAYYGGHSYREVAQIVDAPEGTVKSRIRTGLLRLRDQLLAIDVGGSSWQTS
jgi:RNA polymerase sigma-70 factor (ECF subfamily)